MQYIKFKREYNLTEQQLDIIHLEMKEAKPRYWKDVKAPYKWELFLTIVLDRLKQYYGWDTLNCERARSYLIDRTIAKVIWK